MDVICRLRRRGKEHDAFAAARCRRRASAWAALVGGCSDVWLAHRAPWSNRGGAIDQVTKGSIRVPQAVQVVGVAVGVPAAVSDQVSWTVEVKVNGGD